jgi:tetratricopeptide (TPR) repeat protein
MRKSIRIAALVAAVLSTILPLSAATPGEFYANLLRRGVAEYDAGRYDEAARHLRIAAFGLVETIESYETAHAYLTVAWDKLGQPDRAADSARRVLAAERVQRKYASLALPAAVRTAFERVASRALSATEMAALRGTAPLPPAATQPSRVTTITRPATTTPLPTQPASTTTTVTQPPVTVDRVDVEVTKEPATPPRNTPTQTPAQTTTQTTTQPNTQPAATQPRTTTPPPAATTTTTTATPPRTTAPPVTQPRPATTTPPPAQTTTSTPARVPVTFSAAELATRFAAAERALVTSNLAEARRGYREILESANLSHDNIIRLAEGFYRARDFANALRAFDRAGTLRRGEEPYRYYIAVASYETAQYARAKRELAAALPFIEITPDVARYRAKIESSVAQ